MLILVAQHRKAQLTEQKIEKKAFSSLSVIRINYANAQCLYFPFLCLRHLNPCGALHSHLRLLRWV